MQFTVIIHVIVSVKNFKTAIIKKIFRFEAKGFTHFYLYMNSTYKYAITNIEYYAL